MNPLQTKHVFKKLRMSAFARKIGVLMLALGIGSFLFAYFGAAYFANGDFQSKIINAASAILVGVILVGGGALASTVPDRKLEIDTAAQKIFLTEKLFRTKFEEFSFADVERIDFHQHDLENGAFYDARIILRGGRIIEVPSEDTGDEKHQTEIFEQVKNLLAK